MQMVRRGMRLDSFPAPPTIQLHPVVITVLHFARVFQRLCEKVAQEVVVWGVLKAEIPYVAEVFVKFLCCIVSSSCSM